MNEEEIKISNVQAEMCFVGSLFKNPDLYVSYGNYMRSKYDFFDDAARFLYDSFELYYMKFSQTVDQTKMNVFMSQDEGRLKTYKAYKGWNTIKRFMELADSSDVKNYFNTVKKYSLLREYKRFGYPIDKIVAHKNFEKMDANDIYRIIRIKADKINTVINAGEEAVDLTSSTSDALFGYLDKPAFGLNYPWGMYDEYFLGMREKKVFFEGLVSNSGKSRKLMMLAAHTALVMGKDFLYISNEMSEEDLRSCLITTVINNKCFKELHGIQRCKCEKELILGVYRDNNGNIIRRKIDNDGYYCESVEEYKARISSTDEFKDILEVTNWIDSHANKVYFKDVCDDYSHERVELELRKARIVYDIKYYGYDTLKGYLNDEWSALKQYATRLKEITNEIGMYGHVVFQLSDDTIFTDVFQLSSMNISTSKGIKHVCDMMTLGKKIEKEDYNKYQYISIDRNWGEPIPQNLDLNKNYLACKIDKNRAGDKDKVILFEINLDLNTWDNIGYLVKTKKN